MRWPRPRSGGVVVTGAGAGIGRATALRLCTAGWCVVAVDVDPVALQGLRAAAAGRLPATVVGDVGDDDVLRRAAERGEADGPLAGWVSNAALIQTAPLHEADVAHIDRMLAVDLRANVIGAQLAVRSYLRHEVGGTVVAVSSVHAQRGFAGWALYDTCKGGLESLSRNLSAEYGRLGITANCVAPGAVLTEREVAARRADTDAPWDIPRWQYVEPDEVAAAVEFLLSPAGGAINGQTITVDRGLVGGHPVPERQPE